MFIDNNKDCGRATVKGGRALPGVRPPQQNQAPVPVPKTTEALAILVQHLVFNLEAFRVPILKKELDKGRLALQEALLGYQQLEKTLADVRLSHAAVIEEERARWQASVTELSEQHQSNITQLTQQHAEAEQRLIDEKENIKHQLTKVHDEQLKKLRTECDSLQKAHKQMIEILREENDSIREEIDEKNAVIKKLEQHKVESEKLKNDYEAKEIDLQTANEEITRLKEENIRMMSIALDGKENRLQGVLAEVESLRAVLELKQSEVADLRKALAESNQTADLLPSTLEKVSFLTARCEDLQLQLERKSVYEQEIITENKKLQDSFREERNHKRRLSQHNEELQWKLKQNKEVVSRVLEQAEHESALNRSLISSSYNEHHNTKNNIERTLSFRERSLSNRSYTDGTNRSRKSKNFYDFEDEISPPSSPKVKGVVEKSDSVSYVLEMEESPEIIANRIVRRSFRNATPPKTVPNKSPSNKRPRMKNNPLSLSASTGAIITNMDESDHDRSRSSSVRNGNTSAESNHSDDVFMPWSYHSPNSASSSLKLDDNVDLDYYNDDDEIKLPALPSELRKKDGVQSLPVPKHLAGEAMVSESNSEDESTTSSSSAQL